MKRRGSETRGQRQATHSHQELAQLAARMLVRGEARDFQEAREKSAAALGLHGGDASLEGITLLQAVIDYQSLFDRSELPARNRRLRTAALEAMKFLRAFTPRLHGPVLFGTTFAHTPVGLYLFDDEIEHVTRFLLQHKVPFDLRTPAARRGREAGWPIFDCHRDGVDFELSVLPVARLRQAPQSRLTGAPALSLDESALAQRLAEAPGSYWLDDLPVLLPIGLPEPDR